jgi:MYXO-CTERM domain-containing protein
VLDAIDDCPQLADPDQQDTDGDQLGDVCDPDDDDDGLDDGFTVSGGGGCATGGSSPSGLILVLGALGLAVSRRRRSAALLALPLLAVAAPLARAEEQSFAVERFTAASDHGGLLGVEGATVDAPGAWDLHLALNMSRNPLVVYMESGERRTGELIEDRVTSELGGSFVLFRSVSIAVAVPLIVSQRRSGDATGVGSSLDPLRGGLGDIRISPKVQLLRQHLHGVDLAAVPMFTIPTAQSGNYRGDDGVTFAPSLALARSWRPLRVAVEAGYRARPTATLSNLRVDDELFARAGAGLSLGRAELAVALLVATAASDPMTETENNYAELVAGPDIQLGQHMTVFAYGGLGLHQAFGSPDWRVVTGIRFTGQGAVLGAPRSPPRGARR